ncbi:hypothetical protein V8E36_004017 [Tilletia maclaganii]
MLSFIPSWVAPLIPTLDPTTLIITSLVAAFLCFTQLGRTHLASIYLHLSGSHPSTNLRPVSYFGKDDDWAVFDSFNIFARLHKLIFGVHPTVRRGRAGIKEVSLSGGRWRQICNFAFETSSDVWIPGAILEGWRQKVDPEADGAVAALAALRTSSNSSQQHTDVLSAMANISSEPAATSHPAPVLPSGHPPIELAQPIRAFMDQVNIRPPRGTGAISESWYAARDQRRRLAGLSADALLSTEEISEELAEEARVIRAGQKVFYKYLEPIQVTLLHFSLAGGFSAPRILSVLQQTGYLVPARDPYTKSTTLSTATTASSAANLVRPASVGPTPESFLLPRSQLSPAQQRSSDRTLHRLAETTQFVTDVMQDVDALLPPALYADAWTKAHYEPQSQDEARSHSLCGVGEAEAKFLERVGGGRGWQSIVRVRLLHAAVRAKIWRSSSFDSEGSCPFDTASAFTGGKGTYDTALNGQPINQEDLLATLAGFSVAPLWCISRLGVEELSPQEREDFVALWRHVGFYMGCEPAMLRRWFGDARAALGLLWSIVAHVYPESVTGGGGLTKLQGHGGTNEVVEQGTIAALALLQAVAARPPLNLGMDIHCGLARHFLGPCLSTYLHIPPTTPLTQLRLDLILLTAHVPAHFTSRSPAYPPVLRRRWESRRIKLAKIDVRRQVGDLLGGELAIFGGRWAGAGGQKAAGIAVESAVARSGVEWERAVVATEMTAWLVGAGLLIGWVGVRYLVPIVTSAL